jgi:hypothetical protein
MKTLRTLAVGILVCLTTACTSGPGDSDVSAVLKPEIEKALQAQVQMAKLLGERDAAMPKLDDFKFKVLNKAEQGNGKWVVDFEVTGPGGTQNDRFVMLKGSSGWMLEKE